MSASIMQGKSAWTRGLLPPIFASLVTVSGCNSANSDSADGLGGAPDGGKDNGAGGKVQGAGGRAPASGGASNAGGAESGAMGGIGESSSGGRSTGGSSSGGEAGALGTGGTGSEEPEPRWIAFRTPSTGAGNPLLLVRSDGSLDPVEISEGVFGRYTPSWAPDGKSLIFVEWACCGDPSTAFELSVDDEELGAPIPIHPPLTAGSLIQYAAYSPSGEHILARIPAGSMVSRYALRLRDAEPTEWLSITPPGESALSELAPVWSPDGDSVLMVVGDQSGGQRVYRFDLGQAETEAYEILAESPSPHGGVQELLWSPDSQHFAIRSQQSLHLGSRAHPEVHALTGPSAEGVSEGQGGEGNEAPPAEYGAFYPVAFSPDSKQFFYGAYDEEGWARGSMRLTAVDLADSEALAKSVLLEAQGSHNIIIYSLFLTEPGAIYAAANVESEDRVDVVRIAATKDIETRVRLAEGHAFHGVARVPAGFVLLSDSNADYVPDWLAFTAHDDHSDQSTLLFEFGEGEIAQWSGMMNGPSTRFGGFFRSLAATPDYHSTHAQLWHFTSEGTLNLIFGPLGELGEIGESGAFNHAEDEFVFTLDENGDGHYEVAITGRDGGNFGKARTIAELPDHSGAPEGFVWQP